MRVRLSDGSSFFISEQLRQYFGLVEGIELTLSEIRSLENRYQKVRAERKALEFLSNASHSKAGLSLKLRKKKFSNESINYALSRMEELGYIDDKKFAVEWTNSRIKRLPAGRKAILAGLLKRGISHQIAEECVGSIITAEIERDCAERVLAKITAFRELTTAQIMSKLYSRGFEADTINRILKQKDEPT